MLELGRGLSGAFAIGLMLVADLELVFGAQASLRMPPRE